MKRDNLKIGPKKCKFAKPSVEYFSHTISAGSLKPGEEKRRLCKILHSPRQSKNLAIQWLMQLLLTVHSWIRRHRRKIDRVDEEGFGVDGRSTATGSHEGLLLVDTVPHASLSQARGALCFGHGCIVGARLWRNSAAQLQQQEGGMRVISYCYRALKRHKKIYSPFLLYQNRQSRLSITTCTGFRSL